MWNMDIIGVRFREVGKIHYYLCKSGSVEFKNMVIARTRLGVECGTVVAVKKAWKDKSKLPSEYIIRKATPEDLKSLKSKRGEELAAMEICKKKIIAHRLKMKPVDAEYLFDRSKFVLYFVAESRVDFRKLVKDLAYIFKVRIELRQIGIRDETKMRGGLGVCGRELCCSTFLNDFQVVSLKMAKDQNLSMAPSKLTGACGRLMCCLKYEEDAYRGVLQMMPKIGSEIEVAPGERGTVVSQNAVEESFEVEMQTSQNICERRKIKLFELESLN